MVTEVGMWQGLAVVVLGVLNEVLWLAVGLAVGIFGRYTGRIIGEHVFDGMYVVEDFDEEFWDGVPTGMMCALLSGLTAFCCSIVVGDDAAQIVFYCGCTNGMMLAIVTMGNAAFQSESMCAMTIFVVVFAGCSFGLSVMTVGGSFVADKHNEL
jgi:hypothetical protein